MKQLQVFHNHEFGQIRMVEVDGKMHAVGNDVAKSLGYARPYEAVTAHCKGAVTYRVLTDGGEQVVKVIPEGDIYRLIVKTPIKVKIQKSENGQNVLNDGYLTRYCHPSANMACMPKTSC